MSDEYQPNEVVESQPESEVMPAEPAPKVGSNASPQAKESAAAPDVDAKSESPSADASWGAAEVRELPAKSSSSAGVRSDASQSEMSSLTNMQDLENSRRASGAGKMTGIMAGVNSALRGRGWVVLAVAAVVVGILLFLPPMSLAQKIGAANGYTALTADTPFIEHPDGLKVSRPDGAEGRLRIKLGSVPRADFESQNVPDTVAPAAQQVPAHLVPKSPYYTIDMKSREAVAGTMTVVVPNESEPWETLDLYTWDGEAWRWLPTTLDRDTETLVSTVDVLPTSVMVMQSEMNDQRVAAEAEAEAWPAEGTEGALHEIDLPGLLIGTMGGTTGDIQELPVAVESDEVALAPTVRNWIPGREANPLLVSEMLRTDADRTAHVTHLVDLVKSRGYQGLVIDYRSVSPDDRDLFSTFVRDLADGLHEANLWLALYVDEPQRAEDGSWDTGGYDWTALGAAVDQLRISMTIVPEAYAPGGEAEQLISWATTCVERHKLMPVISTLCTDGQDLVPFSTILASLGEVKVTQTVTESVLPGTKLDFTLGEIGDIETDPETMATQMAMGDTVYWLGTPQWLRTRMDLASRYHLGGVTLRNLFDEGNIAGVLPAVAGYRADVSADSYEMPEVVWEVTNPNGRTVEATAQMTQPKFSWTAPTVTGTYHIAATIAGVDKGGLDILVLEPTSVVTETVTEGEEGEASETGVDPEDEEAEATLTARFVSETVPDNTRFEPGEAFVKTWTMRNAGATEWPEDTVFVFSEGDDLAEADEVEVGEVESGNDVEISVDMVAPEEDGTYKSVWALKAGDETIANGEVYVQIQVGEPPEADPETPEADPETPAAPPPPVAPVASGSFELGGHIRDLGLPFGDKMHYAGMNWAKVQVHFGDGAAGIINAAHAAGFKIQLSAIGGADMVTQPGFEDKFAQWVAQLAANGADAIEVWNEPNIDREWKIGHISPQSYTNLLCKSYAAIKAANPSSAVISAAPAPTGYFGGCSPNGCDDIPWMQGLYNAGAANCMDYIGAHHNSGATSPSARSGHPTGSTHHSWYFLPQTEIYYHTFGGTRKLFYTEMGYASQEGLSGFSDQFAWARGTNNAQQAAWLAEAVSLSVNTGMVRCIIVWNIDFVRYGYDPQDGYAIMRPGGSCPACDALHNVLGSR